MRKALSLFVVLLLLGVSAVAAQNDLPSFEETRCPFTEPTGTDPECGYLTVPEDHFDPSNTNTIDLLVAVFPAEGDNPQDTPLIYLEGGPGGSPLEAIQFSWSQLFSSLNEDYTVVVYDQRGVGFSRPALDCPETVELTLETLDDDIPVEDLNAQYLDALVTCRERLESEGVNVDVYNSAQSAADLAAMRQVLGYEQVNLYGISYGTRLALTAARDYGDEGWIRSMIIDSVYPPEVTLSAANINGARAFEALFESCAADDDCNSAYPNLREVFFDLVDQLNEEPLMLSVLLVDLEDISNVEVVDVRFDGLGLIGALFQALYSDTYVPQLPGAIYDLAAGDPSFWEALLSNDLSSMTIISEGMYLSVQCAEDVLLTTQDELDTIDAQLPDDLRQWVINDPTYGAGLLTFCAESWDSKAADAIETEPVSSDIPTLVAAGSFDPITPPAWAQLAAESLPNSTYIEVPTAGHGAIPSDECATEIALEFLEDPESTPDTSCLSEIDPVTFDIIEPGTGVSLETVENEDLGARLDVPSEWTLQDGDLLSLGGASAAWANGDGTNLLLVLSVGDMGGDPEDLVNLLPVDDVEELDGLETDAGSWTVFSTTVQGLPTDIAVGELDGEAFLVMLIAVSEDQIVDLRETVLYPVLESFELLD